MKSFIYWNIVLIFLFLASAVAFITWIDYRERRLNYDIIPKSAIGEKGWFAVLANEISDRHETGRKRTTFVSRIDDIRLEGDVVGGDLKLARLTTLTTDRPLARPLAGLPSFNRIVFGPGSSVDNHKREIIAYDGASKRTWMISVENGRGLGHFLKDQRVRLNTDGDIASLWALLDAFQLNFDKRRIYRWTTSTQCEFLLAEGERATTTLVVIVDSKHNIVDAQIQTKRHL